MATRPDSASPSRPRVAAIALVVAALLGVGVVLALRSRQPEPAPQQNATSNASISITPLSDSPYLNTGPDARFVGSEACRVCHAGRHASFRHTGMGRSMAAVDLAREPGDAAFDHAASGLHYDVVRRDGQLWHRESRARPGSAAVVHSEFPMKYVVGSGRHSLTYLCEADGFLVESPVTWYAARRKWDMSPGYDRPNHVGFERATGEGCLHCHAGRAEAVDGSLHRVKVIEAAIGCERCHGPGSLHVERHRGTTGPLAATRPTDFTIVNPARLSRELGESICQQCHLRPMAVVPARGRSITEFRPGLPLSDFVHAFQLESENSAMTVVGHVEQMHLSKCYQKSARLTCLTCHSPHSEPEPERRIEYYRAACLSCHPPEACKVSDAKRKAESPANDCTQCHMPRSPTEIPHLAFTHHRVGMHGAASPTPRPQIAKLTAFADLSRFPGIDSRRSLGLGYLEAANRERDPAAIAYYQSESLGLMTGVRAEGLRDSLVDASLARLHFDLHLRSGEVLPLAQSALADPGLVGQERCNLLFLKADALTAQGRHTDATVALRELTALRRHPIDWLLLAECEKALGHTDAWAEALAKATRINPRLVAAHRTLAGHYERRGDLIRAAWHRERASP